MPIRKGSAHIIKENKPIVVPIVIDGFREIYDKTGLKINKIGMKKTIKIKQPLIFNYKNDSIEEIIEKISNAIEQPTNSFI